MSQIFLTENPILKADIDYIFKNLSTREKSKFEKSEILVTGCAGFLGFYMMQFFARYGEELGIKSVTGIDNFKLRKPNWLTSIVKENKKFRLFKFDIAKDRLERLENISSNLVIHMASIASPTSYRKYPLETVEANIWGLKNLLEFFKNKVLQGFLFFSSSEIYGNPPAKWIPTPENYLGNTATIGPRACYDEAKRFGETLCYLYANQFNMPIRIARPFNNFGPGMSLDDQRVPADFAKAILNNQNIKIFSDGSPTRTFCYIADAIKGYLKVLTFDQFEIFNIGIDRPEISINQLAEIYLEKARKTFNYAGKIQYESSRDHDYLTHNPSRRCPDIDNARKHLNYNPTILVDEGVEKFLDFLKLNEGLL